MEYRYVEVFDSDVEEEEKEEDRKGEVAAPTPADKWCVTDKVKEVKTYSFQWTVNNFSERCSECTDLLSSTFSVYEHQWRLKLDLSEGFKEREAVPTPTQVRLVIIVC